MPSPQCRVCLWSPSISPLPTLPLPLAVAVEQVVERMGIIAGQLQAEGGLRLLQHAHPLLPLPLQPLPLQPLAVARCRHLQLPLLLAASAAQAAAALACPCRWLTGTMSVDMMTAMTMTMWNITMTRMGTELLLQLGPGEGSCRRVAASHKRKLAVQRLEAAVWHRQSTMTMMMMMATMVAARMASGGPTSTTAS